MKPLTVPNAQAAVLNLQDEIRRSHESRYDHRLHGVLLVAQGLTCPEVARLLGDSRRSVEYWVRTFERKGLSGLVEGEHAGRPPRLNETQLAQVGVALRQQPTDVGLSSHLWDGKSLSTYIERQFGVHIGVRQSQRLFRQFDFRLRKPRPLLAHADQERQEAHKKTDRHGAG